MLSKTFYTEAKAKSKIVMKKVLQKTPFVERGKKVLAERRLERLTLGHDFEWMTRSHWIYWMVLSAN